MENAPFDIKSSELRTQANVVDQSQAVSKTNKTPEYKKRVRLVSAVGYIFAVSFAAILVGLYYAIVWENKHTPLDVARHTQIDDTHRLIN